MAARLVAHLDGHALMLSEDFSELGWQGSGGALAPLVAGGEVPMVRLRGVAVVIVAVAATPSAVGVVSVTDWVALVEGLTRACDELSQAAVGSGEDGDSLRDAVDQARSAVGVLALHTGDFVGLAERTRTWVELGEPAAVDPMADLTFTEKVAELTRSAAVGDTVTATCRHGDHAHRAQVTVTGPGAWAGDVALFGRVGTYAVSAAAGTLTLARSDGAVWASVDL